MQPQPTATTSELRDARGYPRAAATLPGYNAGRAPGNKGVRYPPTSPTAAEMQLLLDACPDTLVGRRFRGILAVLWRTGMRISEALALREEDVDPQTKSITIRHGKGDKARVVGMDDWGWIELAGWLDVRRTLPFGPVFCVVDGPTTGRRAVSGSDVRKTFRKVALAAGIRRRIHPHALRHGFSVDWMRERGDVYVLQRQLGHANLAITASYLRSIPAHEVVDAVSSRRPPSAPIAHLEAEHGH